jgi:hypothetical protein
VRRFLLALPPKFKQITISIETLLDLESTMVDELIGHLKPSVERINHHSSNTVASLILTENELVVRLSSRLKLSGNGEGNRSKESSSSGGKHGRGCGKGHGRNSGSRGGGHGSGETSDRGNAGRGGGGGNIGDVARDECCYCGRRGNWARECKKKKCDKSCTPHRRTTRRSRRCCSPMPPSLAR